MSLVQPIAVVPGSHEDTVRAVALASATLMARSFDAEDPFAWVTWVGERFTKSVRRMRRPAEIRRVDELRATVEHETIVSGTASATAFAPMAYPDFPPALSKLQVSGLDCERTGDDPRDPEAPAVVLSESVEMSTGKTAAQAAHALGLWVLAIDAEERRAWAEHPRVTIEHGPIKLGPLTIIDSGLTEIAPHIPTALVVPPGGRTVSPDRGTWWS